MLLLINPECIAAHRENPKSRFSEKNLLQRSLRRLYRLNKFIVTVIWDLRSIHVDYLEKGKAITEENYDNLLDSFKNAVKEKGPHGI